MFLMFFIYLYFFMHHKYIHIFFDLDHTLWDFETNAYLTMLDIYKLLHLKEMGITDFDAFFKKYSTHNHILWERYTKGLIKQEELKWKRVWLTLLEYKMGDQELAKKIANLFLEILPGKNQLFPHTIEILTYLKNNGYKLHIISNGFEKTQVSKLKNTHIFNYFDHIITSEKSNSLKPNLPIFEYAFKVTNSNKNNAVLIGDNIQADIIGAKNAGMDCIYINHINNIKNEIATYTIFSLIELETFL